MHVCLLTEKYPPIVGGGESHLEDLAQGLAHRGHTVTILTETPRSLGARRMSPRVEFVEVPGLIDACQAGNFGLALPSLRGALASITDVDIMHVCNKVPAVLCGLLRGDMPGRLCLSTFETVIPGKRVFGLWSDYDLELELSRNVSRLLAADAVICGSALYRDWLLTEGYSEDVVRIVHHGTDTSRFNPNVERRREYRHRRGWDEQKIILVPSRLVPRKRIQDAIRALPKILQNVPNVTLVLTEPSDRNDVEYVENLRRLVAESGLSDAVQWLSDIPFTEMPDLMRAADVAVLPADEDGFGIVLIEALATGVPVVTSDVPGHDEAITPATGVLYRPHDLGQLAQSVVDALTTPDPSRIEAGRARVEKLFTTEQMVSRHLDIYEEVLGGNPSRRRSPATPLRGQSLTTEKV